MTDKVLRTIEACQMLQGCQTLGVGLSGGADSVCLTHILSQNKDRLGLKTIKGIHIHHGIRGEEADRDLEFSRKLCEKLGIEFVSYYINVPCEAEKTGESVEECARRLRYDCFSKSGCDKVATAHNLNDNIETFVFNLTRGASLSGLCGIPYTRDVYIRPLLDCSRAEIEQYINENQLGFVTDSTNFSDDYTRNKIRHNILPLLFEMNPSFDKSFSKCLESLKMSKEFINESAENLLDKSRWDGYYDCNAFADCHDVIKYQVISLILKENNAKDISREHLTSIINIIENGGSVSVCGNIKVNVERKRLFFGEFQKTEYFEIPLNPNENSVSTPIGDYEIEIINKKDLQIVNKQDINCYIDYDKISANVILRNRRDGDEYQLPNRPTKSFKKLFNENKIPVSERDRMLILSDNNDIIWTEFFGVSKKCKIDDNTKNIVKISKVGETND